MASGSGLGSGSGNGGGCGSASVLGSARGSIMPTEPPAFSWRALTLSPATSPLLHLSTWLHSEWMRRKGPDALLPGKRAEEGEGAVEGEERGVGTVREGGMSGGRVADGR